MRYAMITMVLALAACGGTDPSSDHPCAATATAIPQSGASTFCAYHAASGALVATCDVPLAPADTTVVCSDANGNALAAVTWCSGASASAPIACVR